MSKSGLQSLLISSAVLLPLAMPALAEAAPLRTPERAEARYSAALDAATGERAVATLDRRTPVAEMRFDLSQADIIKDLSLTISADPLPGVDPSLPLMVQFNNGAPVRLTTRGQGFDATVSLDTTRARALGNSLRFTHAVPCDATSGGYTLNLDESRLDLRARAKSRSLQMREVESRLSASAFAPDTVGLVASGANATTLQALGAQAIGLRMSSIPDFATTTNSDFSLIMLPRAELYRYTSDESILSGKGAAIELSRDYPTRLFLTGDTDAEVLQSVQAFAQHYLPRSRRSSTSPGEVRVQAPLDYKRTRVAGTQALDSLSVTTGAMREYGFDVADPAATSGQLILRLTRDRQTAPGARMKAVLNGVSLGEARMDNRRKTVAYDIRPGMLVGANNRLTLSTKAASDSDACNASEPFIVIGAGSKLVLDSGNASPATDLSRLAASGSVFASDDGANTAVVLPTGTRDYRAALRITAKLARAHGRGWTQAQFTRGTAPDTDAHILSIEPFGQLDASVKALAPRGLQTAWRGQKTGGENRLASIERFASLDAEEAVRLAARRLRASGEVGAGGVAAVYPGEPGQLLGVITNTPGRSFAGAIEPLASDAHWNGMSGGVTRWNDRSVVMAQAAIPAPGIAVPEVEQPAPWTRFAGLELPALPDFDLPSLPSVDLSGVRETVSDRWHALTTRTPETVENWGAGYASQAQNEAFAMQNPGVPSATPASKPVVKVAENTAPGRSLPTIKLPEVTLPKIKRPDATPAAVDAYVAKAAPATALPKLRGTIDLSEKRHAPKSRFAISQGDWEMRGGELKRKIAGFGTTLRSKLRDAEVATSRTRRNLAERSGIRTPDVPGVKVGPYVLPPAALLLILAFLLAIIGLVTSKSSMRGA